MEPEYDEPMYFDPDLLPATSVAAGRQGLWDYGIEVAVKSKKYGKQTPTLEAGMYGFKGGEELLGVKGYLYRHGNYQLVPVIGGNGDQSASGHVALFLIIAGSCVVCYINHLP